MENEILLDTVSGISEEEQREIIASLDTLTQTRLGKTEFSFDRAIDKTAKKGALFPALVNIIALAVLAAGGLAILLTHTQDQAQFQQGEAHFGLTERKLIAEIRKETAAQLSAKDEEIAEILAKIAGVDADIVKLQGSDLSEAVIHDRLIFLQRLKAEYQARLDALRQERGRLLEDARVRETNLRSQLLAKSGENEEIAARYQQAQADLGTAQEQLRKLTDEEARNALIDKQFDGYYASVNSQIRDNRLDEANSTLASMLDFLETPAFQGIRAFAAQKKQRLATIGSLQSLLAARLTAPPSLASDDAPPAAAVPAPPAAPDPELAARTAAQIAEITQAAEDAAAAASAAYEKTIADLKTQNSKLEKTVTDQNKTITDQKKTIADNKTAQGDSFSFQEKTINDLRTQNQTLQQTVFARESTISELRVQTSELQKTADTLKQQNDAIRQLLQNNN